MFIRNVFGVVEKLVNTAFMVPWVSFILPNLATLFAVTNILDRTMDRQSVALQNQETTFDYIIVGAGSAGCILASRLSENPAIRVLLLEAGGEPSPIFRIPTLAYHLTNQKSYDWAYRTVPQKYAAFGLNNRVSYWASGKALGGSSNIHGLINIRGNVQGYDLIANRTGDPIWTTENILKFYKIVENYNGLFDKREHGHNGDLNIEAPTSVPLTSMILRAGAELGYKTRDPNGKRYEEGFAPMEFYMKDGSRQDVYRSTLKKNMHRPNLVVRKYAFVTRLQFHHGTNKVSGVKYERHGKMYEANAAKETILSAGALSSPKILMLSGIGPKHHLTDMKIHVRADLPVGQRLQDQYGGLVGPFLVPRGYSFEQYRDANLSSTFEWMMTGKGLLSSGRSEGTYSIVTPAAQDAFAPDIHTYLLSHTPKKPKYPFGQQFNLNDAWLDYAEKSVKYGDGFFQLITINRATGTGTVKLQNKNPESSLLIDPKYLEHPQDVRSLVEGIKFAVNLIEKTRTMQGIGAQLFRLPFPGCEHYEFKSDSYYECVGRHATISSFKYCGTAPIGRKGEPDAVVDSRFRVFGIEGLRVIDGSLLRLDEVNTNDVTMRMIGELGAAVIKASWT